MLKLGSYCIIFDKMKNQTNISEMEAKGRMEVRPHIPIGSRPPATVVYGLLYVYRRKAIRVVTRIGKGYLEERENGVWDVCVFNIWYRVKFL